MTTFNVTITRTTTEQCSIDVEAASIDEAKANAISEAEADDEGGQDFDWIISTGTEYEASVDGENDAEPTKTAQADRISELHKTMLDALEDAEYQMDQCARMFRDDVEFQDALANVQGALKAHKDYSDNKPQEITYWIDARHIASSLSIDHGWAWIIKLENGQYTITCAFTQHDRPEDADVIAEYKDGIEQ